MSEDFLSPAPSEPPSDPGHTVILLHGILLNRWWMWPLELFLRSRGFRTLNLTYPSTRKKIEECAQFVSERIEAASQRTPITSVDWVTHSMGGLVARRAITQGITPPTRTLVQLVPPNRGSAMARGWRPSRLYRFLYGTEAGFQLGESAEQVDAICGIPKEISWGIILGETSHGIRDSLLERPHDGVVSHSEMRPSGCSLPETLVEMSHTPLLFLPEVWERAARFLASGRFHLPDEVPDR